MSSDRAVSLAMLAVVAVLALASSASPRLAPGIVTATALLSLAYVGRRSRARGVVAPSSPSTAAPPAPAPPSGLVTDGRAACARRELASAVDRVAEALLRTTSTTHELHEELAELDAALRELDGAVGPALAAAERLCAAVEQAAVAAEESSSSLNELDVALDQLREQGAREPHGLSPNPRSDADSGAGVREAARSAGQLAEGLQRAWTEAERQARDADRGERAVARLRAVLERVGRAARSHEDDNREATRAVETLSAALAELERRS